MSDLDAFRIFTRIMDESVTTGGKRFALRSLFTPDMPGLHLLLHQLEGLVRTYLPALYARLQLLGITASTYASPWFLTLFTYSFPLPLVFRIYDLILSEGAVIMMLKIGLALLRRNEPVILAMGEEDFEPVLEVLKGKGVLGVYYGHEVEGVIKDAALLDSVVTESALTKLTASLSTPCFVCTKYCH
ncbi:RabGAP/TBC [Rhizoclosmatium globosum]|uniref:RabGAP/TBC n=1 Tax=Rhizoclosmatium globosum TaxID=329046 RepID=A0A1Y2C184_9FUNG|nr:RabGAP/TBC [Rhizoclosmatium globosum]|eukprot:ORY40779.1 RabGAP/TBC [Rhizoclosmatium globosum]